MLKLAMKFGLYAAGLFAVYKLVDFLIGFQTEYVSIGVMSAISIFIVPTLFTYQGMKVSQQRFGPLTYVQLLGQGLAITVAAGIISGAYTYLHFIWINPGFANYVVEYLGTQGPELNLTQEEIRLLQVRERENYEASGQAIRVLAGHGFTGGLMSLVGALILRRR
ncbi:MAG: DUF4199 domain-containing protein [Bacteroidota bacterium]